MQYSNLMGEALDRITVSGLIKPGDTYIIMKADQESPELTFLQAVRDDSEVITALTIIVHILYGKKLEMRRILGVKTLVGGKYLLALLCYDTREEKCVIREFVLARLLPVHEAFRLVMRTLGLEWEGFE